MLASDLAEPYGCSVAIETISRRVVVPDGPRHHRRLVRRLGPLVSVSSAAVISLVAAILLIGSDSAWRGIPGFVLAVVAIPTLPMTGIPVMGGAGRWFVAVISSAGVWFVVGAVAARRSSRRPITGWPEWRREWFRLAIGIWVGSLLGIAVAGTLLSVNL
ncbi:MAG: hypothetical protein O3C62_01430 [Actinomycetota bacterium]|nr:hypothetical protein [Actinomycetota bacterium]MDA2970647.1 hypothetical protein [Actinomycetota bacterium]MDA3000325.1 hypothetical protein [Actinomycetota bacterium]